MPERNASTVTIGPNGRLRFDFAGSERSSSAAFEADSPEGLCPSTHLAAIVNTAIRVGRGTETLKNLAAMLEPYGVRRKR